MYLAYTSQNTEIGNFANFRFYAYITITGYTMLHISSFPGILKLLGPLGRSSK